MVYYQQEEPKTDYMKIVLQSLIALLLISLILLAWSVRSWFLSRAEQNLAEQQASSANMDKAIKAEIVQQPMPAAAAPAPQAEPKGDGAVASSVNQALETLQQQPPPQPLALAAPDRGALQPATKEDANYVSALTSQYQDRGKTPENLSDEELAKRINASSGRAAQEKAVDTTNKVLLAASRHEGVQGELEGLVAASLQTLSEEKHAPAAPQNYLQGLQQEAQVRENEARTVVVKAGDTLTAISARAYGSANQYMKIFRANPTLVTDPNRIFIGQVLRVPL